MERRPGTERIFGEPGPTERLLLRWRDGERPAGDALFARYYPRLQALAHRLFPGPLRRLVDAEDLVQDACMEACRSVERFEYRGKGSFGSWLFAILEHRVWSRWRRERAQRRDVLRARTLTASLGIPAPQDTPSRRLSHREDADALREAIRCLSRDHRRVVEARYLEEKPWNAIAEEMGRTKEASQMLLLRALRSLHRRIRPE